MRSIYLGVSGRASSQAAPVAAFDVLPDQLARGAEVLAGGALLRPIQALAANSGVFESRRNLVVAAPTNSGKTLVGMLVLCEALARGQRAVLIEPMRALAQEKADELRPRLTELGRIVGAPIGLSIATGDYRLEGEKYSDPAPGAHLVIATPERLDAILRSSENAPWFETLGAVVVDEAHLVSESLRGATLETLITAMLMLPAPPRIALLSATLSDTDALAAWLDPCDVISVTERTPPLEKWLLELQEGDDKNEHVADWLEGAVAEPDSQAIVFIYQASHTASTAKKLTERLGPLAGAAGALAYHSKLSPVQRQLVREQFVAGTCRVLVTTSALAMGVNLPATHVVVRDLTYREGESPGISQILQMMGRAGRGDRAGTAVVIKAPKDKWDTEVLAAHLRQEQLPPLRSVLVEQGGAARGAPVAANAVTALLLRSGEQGQSLADLEAFFDRSLGGKAIAPQARAALDWLRCRHLTFQDEETHNQRLTRLGEACARTMLPPALGARFAGLLRDLLSLDEDSKTIGRWAPLDFLIVLDLLQDDLPSVRKYSKEMEQQVASWCEAHPHEVPMLYRRWLKGAKGHSQAAEVLGSLDVRPIERKEDVDEWSRMRGVVAVFHAIVIYERAQGRSIEDLTRQFDLNNLEGVEEKWRDTLIWLLAGLARILDTKCFFFHLKQDCGASDERIKQVTGMFGDMRRTCLELMDRLTYASPLGGFLIRLKRMGQKGVGLQTIRTLEGAGIATPLELSVLSIEDLVKLGVRRDISRRVAAQVAAMRG